MYVCRQSWKSKRERWRAQNDEWKQQQEAVGARDHSTRADLTAFRPAPPPTDQVLANQRDDDRKQLDKEVSRGRRRWVSRV